MYSLCARFSLCQRSRLVRGWHCRVHRRTPGLHVRKSAARAVVGRGEEASCRLQRCVASSDQKSLRDPACSVYGLRVGEVCCLRLEDIDWDEERIAVRRPKRRKAQTYPLTTEVGNALLRYLKEVRPRCPHREVLLTLRRPYRPVSVGALSTMTQKLLKKRLGLKLKRYGSHVLRHACATHLLAQV